MPGYVSEMLFEGYKEELQAQPYACGMGKTRGWVSVLGRREILSGSEVPGFSKGLKPFPELRILCEVVWLTFLGILERF